jgi:hypothetical protein
MIIRLPVRQKTDAVSVLERYKGMTDACEHPASGTQDPQTGLEFAI